MTEEIIVDGVDVAGCEFCKPSPLYKKEYSCHCRGYIQDNGLHAHLSCEHNPYCYYKQLKRLEQENKELRTEIKSFMNGDYCADGCKKMNNAFRDAHTSIVNKNNKYHSALEEINLILNELEQQYDYMTDYSEIKEIQDKINEALNA